MCEKKAKLFTFFFLLFTVHFSLLLGGYFCHASPMSRGAIEGVWDPAKYIGIDEVKPGMEAYCLTTYKGTDVEKFNLEVLSVVRNMSPGRDAILVQGTDERFIRTGPVGGCSGSPVYIDGRLAGALAFAWYYSKDPVYGATPIEEMLRVGQGGPAKQGAGQRAYAFDFSKPLDFAEIDKQIRARSEEWKAKIATRNTRYGIQDLPCLLVTSGLPPEVCQQLAASLEPYGLRTVSGGGSGIGARNPGAAEQAATLTPGATLCVPLMAGDMTATVTGTVTEVVDNKVYGFGHSYLGYGPVDLPMATGYIHTVISSLSRSSKLASPTEIVGALTADESAAVFGLIGAKAKMIPVTVRVDHYGDSEKRVYNCQVCNNQLLTPSLLRSAVAGAALMVGDLPPDHTIEYKVTIAVSRPVGIEPITFQNISANQSLTEMLIDSTSSVAMLIDNPYGKVDIKSIDFDVRITPKNTVSHVWSIDLSDSKVKAGEQVEIEAVVESYLAEKKKYKFSLEIPEDLAPGRYDLIVCGAYGYQDFVRKAAPYRFIYQDVPTLFEAMRYLLALNRDKLYCLLVLPPRGVMVEKAELPDLPATKVLVLRDATRTLKTQPCPRWVEKSLRTDTVVTNQRVMLITVEK